MANQPPMNILRPILLAVASLFVLAHTAQAHYDPNIGRWISRDPIEEDGGFNLYGFVGNDGVNNVDYLGQDCIVLAHRRVIGPTWHYALEKFKGCCPKKGEQVDYDEWVGKQAKATAKVELLNIQGVTAEHYGATPNQSGLGKSPGFKYGWKRTALLGLYGVSAIHQDVWEPADVHFANIYDDSDGNVDRKWRQVLGVAQSYAYAEQGFTGRKIESWELQFSRFPRSIYYAFGNNSNVFVRYLIGRTGMKKMELRGWHPPEGRDEPQEDFPFSDYRNPKAGR